MLICICSCCIIQVGYDAGDQFSFHWWDHVFNKTAKSIVVQESDVRMLAVTCAGLKGCLTDVFDEMFFIFLTPFNVHTGRSRSGEV